MLPALGGADRARDGLRHAVPARLRAVLLARQVALFRRRQEDDELLSDAPFAVRQKATAILKETSKL